jgi:hypothetical protein
MRAMLHRPSRQCGESAIRSENRRLIHKHSSADH